MGIVIGIALTIAVVVAIAWPFIKTRSDPKRGKGRLSDTARLKLARADIYEQIGQLETDRDAGIIGGDEYSAHLRELRISAAELLRAQERLAAELTTEDQLELEIEAARRGSVPGSSAPVEPDDGQEPDTDRSK
ncbi:MAG: hypothetical protein IH868_08315 [Chloroflexi bacterium]|nr:hypothetical protein [Chloroflexota bacterium]